MMCVAQRSPSKAAAAVVAAVKLAAEAAASGVAHVSQHWLHLPPRTLSRVNLYLGISRSSFRRFDCHALLRRCKNAARYTQCARGNLKRSLTMLRAYPWPAAEVSNHCGSMPSSQAGVADSSKVGPCLYSGWLLQCARPCCPVHPPPIFSCVSAVLRQPSRGLCIYKASPLPQCEEASRLHDKEQTSRAVSEARKFSNHYAADPAQLLQLQIDKGHHSGAHTWLTMHWPIAGKEVNGFAIWWVLRAGDTSSPGSVCAPPQPALDSRWLLLSTGGAPEASHPG